jgi:hypothetical protein
MSEHEPDSGYKRLENQIRWYDSKSMSSQHWYKWAKVAQMVIAALVPLSAFLSKVVTALCGVAIVLLEGLIQINQWGQTWITYRSTCESLRHEKYSFLGRSGVYAAATTDEAAKKILVERVEALISTEHAKWISQEEYTLKSLQKHNEPQ